MIASKINMSLSHGLATSGLEQTTNTADGSASTHGNATAVDALAGFVTDSFSLIGRRTLQLLLLLQAVANSALVSFVHSIIRRVMSTVVVMMMMMRLQRFVHLIRVIVHQFVIHWHGITMLWISLQHNCIGRTNHAHISRTRSLGDCWRRFWCVGRLGRC